MERRRIVASCWVPPSVVLLTAMLAAPAAAQCANAWSSGSPVPGVAGLDVATAARALTTWDRDGAGPLPPLLVVAGDFRVAGALPARSIAAVDPATGGWSTFGSGVDGEVRALAAMPNGDLVAAGTFTTAGGVAATNVARWDGTSWHALGAGLSGTVRALAALPNGDVVAGGSSLNTALDGLLRWNGTNWSPLGVSSGGEVYALAWRPTAGELVVGGIFVAAGAPSSPCVARWNGSTWLPMGAGTNNLVRTIAIAPNGDVVVGGIFTAAGGVGASLIARWDGAAWSAFSGGLTGQPGALAVTSSGVVVAGGAEGQKLERWLFGWSPLLLPTEVPATSVHALVAGTNGDVFVAGYLRSVAGVGVSNVARWNATSGFAVIGGGGLNSPATALTRLADGSTVAGGAFQAPFRSVARWDGTSWSPLGTGFPGYVRALATLADGDVLAGGVVVPAGVPGADAVMRWNGTTWASLGIGNTGVSVVALAQLPNGDVVAGGSFTSAGGVAANRIARWNGTAWSPLGSGTNGPVFALAAMPNGDLVAGGMFTTAGGVPADNVARWDGATWSALGAGISGPTIGGSNPPYVAALALLPGGDLVAGGRFDTAGGLPARLIARWDGASWMAMGQGLGGLHPYDSVPAVAALPNGDVAAGVLTLSGGGLPGAWRWNGAAWSSMGLDGYAPAFAMGPRGLAVGGSFLTAGATVAPFFAELTTTCPAAAVVAGPGCTGSAGPCVLSATALPWIGATFRARATGLPPSSFALVGSGVTPFALPLAAVLPQALPGCTAWVLPDLLDLVVPSGGVADTRITLPNAPVLVGATFHQQVLPFVLDGSGALVEVTTTNSLTMTVGAF